MPKQSREPFNWECEKRREREVWLGVLNDIAPEVWAQAALRCGKASPQGFYWDDERADVKEGADVKAKRSDLNISLRALLIGREHNPKWELDITITSIRDYQDGKVWRTEIDKIRDGLCDVGMCGWHDLGKSAKMWFMYDLKRVQEKLMERIEKLPDIENRNGRGGGVCWFKSVPIQWLVWADAVLDHSPGHPAFDRSQARLF